MRPLNSNHSATRSLIMGGILPVVAFALVEEWFGTSIGLVMGMLCGIGEIIVEKIKDGGVSSVTWIGNALLLLLGGLSLFTSQGIWFKLQPTILETISAVIFIGSVILCRPFLSLFAEKQNLLTSLSPKMTPIIQKYFRGMTLRLGVFFLLHAIISSFAAFYWSTKIWALLKGIGFSVSLLAYLVIEGICLRQKIVREAHIIGR